LPPYAEGKISYSKDSDKFYTNSFIIGASHESGFGIFDVQYSKLSINGSHHFGCVSMKSPQYCILNKQYSKEEYTKLKEKIIEDMSQNPYVDSIRNVYKYGEYFPLEFSPHYYNDTFSQRFFTLIKEEVDKNGLGWYEVDSKIYSITKNIDNLPDHIKNTNTSIFNEVIQCPTCPRGYRILEKELNFLKQYNLPLPRNCPFCRVWSKVDLWVNNMKQVERKCNLCQVHFKTHIKEDQFPLVYCLSCWKREYK
jgi:hypothetical protein